MSSKVELDLDCRVSVHRDRLRVEYQVRNLSGKDAGLFNRLSPDFAPDNVYIDFDSGLLELLKQVLPVPRGMQVSNQQIPYVSKVSAHERFHEEFVVPLPAKMNHPMRLLILASTARGAEIVADHPAQSDEVRVSIGAFPIDPGMKLIQDIPAHPEVFRVWPPGPAVDNQVILSKTIKLASPVPVLTYAVRKREDQ